MDNLFWERFYNLCTLKGTKPNPVAKEIDISSGIVTKWKNIGTLPNGETLIKIADYFNCSVDYLLGRTDVPEVNRSMDEKQQTTLRIAAFGGGTQTVVYDKPPLEEEADMEALHAAFENNEDNK